MKPVIYSKDMNKISLVYLISKIEKSKNVSANKRTPCYFVEDYAIIKSSIKCSDYDAQESAIKKVSKLFDDGVNVTKIYGYLCDEDTKETFSNGDAYATSWFVMDKAKGLPLYGGINYRSYLEEDQTDELNKMLDYIQKLSNAPQSYFDKYVSDYLSIVKSGVMVDPSKKSNFFYDEKLGFSFIDLRNVMDNFNDKYLIMEILSPINPPFLSADNNSADVVSKYNTSTANLLLKMNNALLSNSFTQEQIDDAFIPKSNGTVSYGGIRFGSFNSVSEAMDYIETSQM